MKTASSISYSGAVKVDRDFEGGDLLTKKGKPVAGSHQPSGNSLPDAGNRN
jgi:hypothetical protein